MARNIVQALAGIDFPCELSRIVEYARRNELSGRAMENLQQLPERQFCSLDDLLSSLPGRRRATRFRVVDESAAPQAAPPAPSQGRQEAEAPPAPSFPGGDIDPFMTFWQWQHVWLDWVALGVKAYCRMMTPPGRRE